MQAGQRPSDIVALACLIAAIAILSQRIDCRPTASPRKGLAGGLGSSILDRCSLAALAAGLAVGSKVTMLAPVAVITIGILHRHGVKATRPPRRDLGRRPLRHRWLLVSAQPRPRGQPTSLVWGSVPPGPTQQEALYPRPAHSMAEYLADRHAWDRLLLPGFAETLGPLWFVILLAFLRRAAAWPASPARHT